MVKLFQAQFPYDFPWTTTVTGFWSKYPNPHATHVLSVDTLERSIDPETGVLRTERLLGCKQGVPKWIMRMLGVTEEAFVREVIFVDPANQITSMCSVNLSLSQYVQCIELISYTPDEETPLSATTFTQRAHISAPPQGHPPYLKSSGNGAPLSKSMSRILGSVGAKLEQSSVDRFSMNAATGKKGFDGVLKEVARELESRRDNKAVAAAAAAPAA